VAGSREGVGKEISSRVGRNRRGKRCHGQLSWGGESTSYEKKKTRGENLPVNATEVKGIDKNTGKKKKFRYFKLKGWGGEGRNVWEGGVLSLTGWSSWERKIGGN